MDIKRGMDFVRKVLVLDFGLVFYLDFLVWGYYKLGNCLEVKKIFFSIVKEFI